MPILKYVDILIGLAVVMLLVSTVVLAIAQAVLKSSFARARYLREGLQELIGNVDSASLGEHKNYIAQRVQRHPLVGRPHTWLGAGLHRALVMATWPFRWLNSAVVGFDQVQRRFYWTALATEYLVVLALLNRASHAFSTPMFIVIVVALVALVVRGLKLSRSLHGVPAVNPADAVQREELIWILLEWAAGEGPMVSQDRAFPKTEQCEHAEQARAAVRDALRTAGVANPGEVLRNIRQRALEEERANPQLPAAHWRAQATLFAAPSELTGKLTAWFDNTIDRTRTSFGLEAKVISSIIALVVCLSIQLDGLDLLKRLSKDDALRAALVKRSDLAIQAYERIVEKPTENETAKEQAKKEMTEALNVLRDSEISVVPSHLLWEDVEQAVVSNAEASAAKKRTLVLNQTKLELSAMGLTDALSQSGAPVAAYLTKNKDLLLVASDPAVTKISLLAGDPQVETAGETDRDFDSTGAWRRFPGVLVSWILVSLGAPFWYDLLKKLMPLRSMLLKKDDEEREARRASQVEAGKAPAHVESAEPIRSEAKLVLVKTATELRSGKPSTQAPSVRGLDEGTWEPTVGSVRGESLKLAGSTDCDEWYQTTDGYFFWAGAARSPVTTSSTQGVTP